MNQREEIIEEIVQKFEELGVFTEDGAEPILDFLGENVDENGKDVLILDWLRKVLSAALEEGRKIEHKMLIKEIRDGIEIDGKTLGEIVDDLPAIKALTPKRTNNAMNKWNRQKLEEPLCPKCGEETKLRFVGRSFGTGAITIGPYGMHATCVRCSYTFLTPDLMDENRK